jgi:hypothetical protein
MARRGLGARVELTAGRIRLKELWPGAGWKAMHELNELDDQHRDAWCRSFLEDLMLVLLNPETPTIRR